MRKGFLSVILLTLILVLTVYLVPQFIDFNKYKGKLTQEIETTFEIPIKIDGDINISILPNIYISAKDVKILTPDRSANLITIKNIYIELSLKDLLNIETAQLTKIILNGLDMDLTDNTGRESKQTILSKILSGNLFNKIKTIKIQDSKLKYFDGFEQKNEIVDDVNLNITKNQEDQKNYVAVGNFTLRQLKSNIKSTFIISDLDNYDTIASINYKNSKTENVQLDLKMSRRQDLFNIIGDIVIKSNNIEKLINTVIPSFPNLKLTDGPSKLSSKIQFANNILQINEFQITNYNTFGSGNLSYDLKTKEKNLKIHYKNYEIPKNLTSSQEQIKLLKDIISQLTNIKVHITTDSFKTNDIKINNLEIKAENKQEKNKITINDLKISSDKINGTGNGNILIENDILKIYMDISGTSNIKYNIINLNPIIVNSFNGNIAGSYDNLSININSIRTNIGTFTGKIQKQKIKNYKYNIDLNSDSVNIDNILRKNIFEFIKSKNQDEFFKNSDFSIKLNSKDLIIHKQNMKSFFIICDIFNDSIAISKLNWSTDGYNISISGKLDNIIKQNGIMNGINYEIKSFDFTNVNIGYLTQIPFLSNLLQKESGTIKFVLNGYADNPNISIYGKTSNMDLSAIIKQNNNKQKNIDVTINHNNSKLFINQLYGETYTITQKILKDKPVTIKTKIINEDKNILFSNLSIISNKQKINGSIKISENGKISAQMQSNRIDITKLIKNSNDDYKQNLLIYILNNTGSNINLNIDSFKTYTRTYKNLSLQINKNGQNPNFAVSTDFGNSNITINGTINGNQYTGNIKLNNAVITEPFFNITGYDILSGNLNSNIKYETFGTNKREIISNLSGNITADFIDGECIGFSDKEKIENKIYSSPVITTNDVIQIIEDSLSKGESNFNTITINANITGGKIENGQIIIKTDDLLINGSLNANISDKQFSISGKTVISNILPNPTSATYKVIGNESGNKKEISLESIISKVNPTFFKMKQREYMDKLKQEKAKTENQTDQIEE